MPPLLRDARIDRVEKVASADALAMTRRPSREFGLLVGPANGAHVTAAQRLATELGSTARVGTIRCNRAERDYSPKLFADSPAP